MRELKAKCQTLGGTPDVYFKSEVDDAIAELKAALDKEKAWSETLSKNEVTMSQEIERLNAALESEKASRYAEGVDAGMRERRLRRALWQARAKSAENAVTNWCRECMERWNSVERKCLKKAEEYK